VVVGPLEYLWGLANLVWKLVAASWRYSGTSGEHWRINSRYPSRYGKIPYDKAPTLSASGHQRRSRHDQQSRRRDGENLLPIYEPFVTGAQKHDWLIISPKVTTSRPWFRCLFSNEAVVPRIVALFGVGNGCLRTQAIWKANAGRAEDGYLYKRPLGTKEGTSRTGLRSARFVKS
jgi:hypothetical protein